MKSFTRLSTVTGLLAGGLMIASLAITAGPASAGQDKFLCVSDMYVAGASYSTGASTTKPDAGRCGHVRVQALYKLYAGSPIYYSGWVEGTCGASVNPGNIIIGGRHTTTAPTSGYAGNFPFPT